MPHDRCRSRGIIILSGCLILALSLIACGTTETVPDQAATSPTATPIADASPVAEMFLRNRQQLLPASDNVKSSLNAGMASFTTPIGGGSQIISVDLSLSNKSPATGLVILAVLPYQVGNVVSGPGARFRVVESKGLALGPLESKQVTVDLIRERVSSAPVPGGPGGQPPPAISGPRASGFLQIPVIGSAGTAGRSSAGAAEAGAQESDEMSPLDPALGMQVLFVVGIAGEVPADAWQDVNVVPDSEFSSRYGKYMGYQYGLAVPVERIA